MAARKKAEELLPDAPEAEGGPPELSEDDILDAVIVVKHRGEEGQIIPEVILNGNIEWTEVATLLKAGTKAWDKKLDQLLS